MGLPLYAERISEVVRLIKGGGLLPGYVNLPVHVLGET
jgi:hypothetical protein